MWICVTCTVQFLECVQIFLSTVMGTVYRAMGTPSVYLELHNPPNRKEHTMDLVIL